MLREIERDLHRHAAVASDPKLHGKLHRLHGVVRDFAHEEKDIAKMVRAIVGEALRTRSAGDDLLDHLLRELKHLGHDLHEDWQQLTEAGEHPERAEQKLRPSLNDGAMHRPSRKTRSRARKCSTST
jgi:hypothetical protein